MWLLIIFSVFNWDFLLSHISEQGLSSWWISNITEKGFWEIKCQNNIWHVFLTHAYPHKTWSQDCLKMHVETKTLILTNALAKPNVKDNLPSAQGWPQKDWHRMTNKKQTTYSPRTQKEQSSTFNSRGQFPLEIDFGIQTTIDQNHFYIPASRKELYLPFSFLVDLGFFCMKKIVLQKKSNFYDSCCIWQILQHVTHFKMR